MKRLRDGALPLAAAKVARASLPIYSYPTNYNDHFETSLQAYTDLLPALDALCKKLQRTRATLSIYDPFYCNGRVKTTLASLGFENVYNANEDCYAAWAAKKAPQFDVIITNPPYSEDHKRRSLEFCLSSQKPFFWLVPSYTIQRQYYKQAVEQGSGSGGAVFFALPRAQYTYDHPEGTGAEASPFASLWVASGGVGCPNLINQWRHATQGAAGGSVTLCSTPAEAAQEGGLPTAKRPNPKQRKRLKKLLAASGKKGTGPEHVK